MSLGERIKELRGKQSVADFCSKFAIHRNTLPRYEQGKRSPNANFLATLCRTYQVNPAWLLLGEGPKLPADKTGASEPTDPIIPDIVRVCIAHENTLVEVASALGVFALELEVEVDNMAEKGGADNSNLIGLAYMACCMRKDIEGKIEENRISPEAIISLLL